MPIYSWKIDLKSHPSCREDKRYTYQTFAICINHIASLYIAILNRTVITEPVSIIFIGYNQQSRLKPTNVDQIRKQNEWNLKRTNLTSLTIIILTRTNNFPVRKAWSVVSGRSSHQVCYLKCKASLSTCPDVLNFSCVVIFLDASRYDYDKLVVTQTIVRKPTCLLHDVLKCVKLRPLCPHVRMS